MERISRFYDAICAGMCIILRPEETAQQKIQKILEKSDEQVLQEDWDAVVNDIRTILGCTKE